MKRTLYGLLAFFLGFLLVRASSYGAVGRFVEHTGDRLLGSAGVALLTVVLFVVAFRLLVPATVRRWLLSFPWERAETSHVVAPRQPRRRAPPRQQLVVVTGADLQGLGLQGLIAAMQGAQPSYEGLQNHVQTPAEALQLRAAPVDIPTAPPLQRRKLDDVRGALKEMGFKGYEYDPVIAAMDPEAPIETLLRDAIRTLSRPDASRVVRPS